MESEVRKRDSDKEKNEFVNVQDRIKMVSDISIPLTIQMEPKVYVKELEQNNEFDNFNLDINIEGVQSAQPGKEYTFHNVKVSESVSIYKICGICGKKFQSYKNEVQLNKNSNYSTCEECSSCGPRRKITLGNMYDVNVYQCGKCFKSFARKDGLVRHNLTHLDLKPYTCQICKKSFKRNDKLLQHLKEVHGQNLINGNKPSTCVICGKQQGVISVFKDNKSFYFCNTCNLSRMERINSTNNNKCKLFECDICSSKFSRKDHAVRHRLSHLDAKPYECYICKKSFNRSDRLSRHLKIHPNAKPFSCKVCSQAFADRIELKNHQATHGGLKYQHKCSICQQIFSDNNRLQHHLTVHDDYKPYNCELCENKFNQLETLLSHQQIHSNLNQFKCTVCGLGFKMEETLTTHLLVHSNVPPYTCQICLKTFMRRDKLKSHSLVHLDIRPFVCRVCNSAFKRKDKYVRHCRDVHSVDPEQTVLINVCDLCGETFNCEDDLAEHKMTHYRY